MPSTQDDWSDSDEDIGAGMETDVLLGVPDGSVETDADIRDAAVSRIGGLPAFLPSRELSFSSCQCKVCSDPMELLLQVWCPFENSPMDRALYVWGCARSTCQRHVGSVRAWRGLRYNAVYAAKLKKKQTRNAGQQKTMKTAAEPMAFGLGDQIFGNPAIDISEQPDQDPNDCGDAESDDSEESLITAMASTRVTDSFWAAAPTYPAVYLSTLSEYIPQPSKEKLPTDTRIEDLADVDGKAGKDATWALETYENSLKIDNIFDRFTKRVEFTGEQCLRYELGGTPLPFASDKVFEQLFPTPSQATLPITKGEFKVVQTTKRSYSTASIPPCPSCKSSRVFECQLMPNLINVLRNSVGDERRLTDEQRIKVVQDALKRNKEPGSRGMEWGTCMVFSCGNDCCLDDGGQDDKGCWREEYVLVQWDE
ncbi:programmed cell death protein 2 [Boletus edulis BED1]|uniref:Programmed cell death protein 2 n=1 Tax=Boletus edulis BED1 TaxID=1328754 RepID=A0AAD4C5A2_BOLED|nr:programmed cell death protein 2 [Boletus edulis BED1]